MYPNILDLTPSIDFRALSWRCHDQILTVHQGACSNNTSPPAIRSDYGEFEINLCLPKAILRADGGLQYRCKFALGTIQGITAGVSKKRLVLLEEEFQIPDIRCYCILGINPWERVEKQAVHISLKFCGPGLQEWGSTVVETYQALIREVAEVR